MALSRDARCPITRALSLFGSKWRAQIIFVLCEQSPLRFGELKRALGPITNTMLTSALKDLEAQGIVKREQFNEIPPHTQYSLTEKGRGLYPVFQEYMAWSERYEE